MKMTKNELHAGQQMPDDAQLLADEAKYCSFGDTVHYVEHPNIFAHCEGSYMYDTAGKILPGSPDVVFGGQLRLWQ